MFKPMEIATMFVKSFGGRPVPGDNIVTHFVNVHNLNYHQAAGAVGNAVKYGHIQVCGKIKVQGKSNNLFV